MANNVRVVQGVLRALVTRKSANFNSGILSPLTVVSSTDDGNSHFQWAVDSSDVNKDGILHSGCISAIIDLSTCLSVMGMKDPILPMSINIDVRYTGDIRIGETADIFTEVKKRGKMISVLEATLRHSVTRDLIATGKHTVASSDSSLLLFETVHTLPEYVELLRNETNRI